MAVMIDLRGSSANTENLLRIRSGPANRLKRPCKEGAIAWTPSKNTHCNSKGEKGPQEEENLLNKSPQMDTAQHYLDDNFSDVIRSSVLGSNVSSLFNTTTFNTTQNEHKVTLDWILPDGRNSQLETLKDKHITDFSALGGVARRGLHHGLPGSPHRSPMSSWIPITPGHCSRMASMHS